MRIGLWIGAGLVIATFVGLASDRAKIFFDPFTTPSVSMEDIDVQDCSPPADC